MKLEEQIRTLARNSYWQEIFSSSQKCSGIQLFENQSNFSGIQYLFLYWLKVYYMLYNELYSFEWENLDEEVLKDNDRCDAFLYWRKKEQEKRIRKNNREERKNRKKSGKFNIFSGAKNKEVKGG
jgi:hypothetical protein